MELPTVPCRSVTRQRQTAGDDGATPPQAPHPHPVGPKSGHGIIPAHTAHRHRAANLPNYSRSMPAPAHRDPHLNTVLWLIATLASIVLVVLALALSISSSLALIPLTFAVAFVVTAAGSLIRSTRSGTVTPP